jgi:hypothetical protein
MSRSGLFWDDSRAGLLIFVSSTALPKSKLLLSAGTDDQMKKAKSNFSSSTRFLVCDEVLLPIFDQHDQSRRPGI